jgi:hypothetical protein
MRTRTSFLVYALGTCLLWAGTTQGDIIKLKNGTAIDGEIIAETDSEYTIETSRAGGSIRTKDNVAKSDVTEIVKATAEQKAERAYNDTLRYKLDPNQSFTKDYYDRILEGVFRKFLKDYPNSAFEKEMGSRVVEWEAERDKVASGFAKQTGRWTLITEQLLEQAQSSLVTLQYPSAAQFIEQLFNSNPSEEVATRAQELRKKIYQDWLQWLQQQKVDLQTKLDTAEQELQLANKELKAARTELTKATYKEIGGSK